MNSELHWPMSTNRRHARIMRMTVEKILKDRGYWVRKSGVHTKRITILAMLYIAITQISTLTGRSPEAVFNTLRILVMRAFAGTKYTPYMVLAFAAYKQRGREVRFSLDSDADPGSCPCCGGAVEPYDFDLDLEVLRERFPAVVTAIEEIERNSPRYQCGGVCGAGTGGLGPEAGGVRTVSGPDCED